MNEDITLLCYRLYKIITRTCIIYLGEIALLLFCRVEFRMLYFYLSSNMLESFSDLSPLQMETDFFSHRWFLC